MTVVGIDIGGSKILAASVDVTAGQVLRELRTPTPVSAGGDAVLKKLPDPLREVALDARLRGRVP